MSDIEKLIDKMKRQPHGIRCEEAEKVLQHYGYRNDRQRGSHRQYINSDGDVMTIKVQNTLKAVYVKDILARISKEKNK